MARNYYPVTLKLLKVISASPGINTRALFPSYESGKSYKDFYNTIYRLIEQGYVERKEQGSRISLWITDEGAKLLKRFQPEKDGMWKIIIFDIPEKHKYVRVVLRSKLKALHFKKWQNSIWVSPFALDEEIEAELDALSKKFFIRLIKTNDINRTEDLEKLFI